MPAGETRAALIGFGLAGSVFHAPLIEATPGLGVATIVTANEERAARARAAYPAAVVESSVDTVWERAGEHDFVVVAAANSVHVEFAERAIEAGLPVVVDKPLAPTAAQARALVEKAEAAGVLLTPFHNRRWDSDFLTLRRLVADGELGEVFRFESRFERFRPVAPEAAWRFETAREQGGGVLLDLGTHLVDQALELLGPAAEVHGEVNARRGGPADDDAFVAIRHTSGAVSHLSASELAAAPGPRMRVLGSEGAFVAEALDGQEDALREGGLPDGDWGVEPTERWGRLHRGEESQPVPSERGAWPEFYRRFEAALRGKGEVPVDPWDAVATLEVLERAAA